jgi:hypothetical protein
MPISPQQGHVTQGSNGVARTIAYQLGVGQRGGRGGIDPLRLIKEHPALQYDYSLSEDAGLMPS